MQNLGFGKSLIEKNTPKLVIAVVINRMFYYLLAYLHEILQRLILLQTLYISSMIFVNMIIDP